MGLAFSPDSSTLAVGSWNGRSRSFVRLWDVISGRPETSDLPGIEGTQVWALAFSPDGDTLAGGGPVRDHGPGSRAYVWDLSDGGRLEGHVQTPQPIDHPSRAERRWWSCICLWLFRRPAHLTVWCPGRSRRRTACRA